jgi:dCTP deaminase
MTTECNPAAGVVPAQEIRNMIANRQIDARFDGIDPTQIQPASIDLRLGEFAYRVRSSFLPNAHESIMDKINRLDGLPSISLRHGAVLEKGAVYIAEVIEALDLPAGVRAHANPKSSTGRLDILARLIAEHTPSFDRIPAGYTGRLFLEIAPRSFSVIVRTGTKLNQLRFIRGSADVPADELLELFEQRQIVDDGAPPRDGLLPITLDLSGEAGIPIAYAAKKHTGKIDLERIGHYDVEDFWDPVSATRSGEIILDPSGFYILRSRECIGCPPFLASEVRAITTTSGEFRSHLAGFIDCGFNWTNGMAQGGKLVLEVRAHEVPFTLEHGQIVAWAGYERMTHVPDILYGAGIKSNYAQQGLALAKQFKKPTIRQQA